MDNALKLRVMFDAIDNLTKPLKNILAGSKGLGDSLKQTRRELTDMGKTQKTIGEFRELRGGLTATAAQLNTARGRVAELAQQIRATDSPSRELTRNFERAKQAASQLTTEHDRQRARVQELRQQLAGAGISTNDLSRHERELRTNMAATSATMSEQMRKLDAISEREKRVASARRSMEKMQGVAAGMAVGGYAAKSTGAHIFGGLHETLDEAKKAQNEIGRIKALGLGDHATKDAVNFARNMNVHGSSYTDNLTNVRDAMTIFADEHHAQMAAPVLSKMKFANEAMYGEEGGHENEEKFMNMLKAVELRGGTKDEATFRDETNRIQKVISATGGRVGGDQWMEFIQRGGVAAKSLSKDAFYYQMEPLIQEMGGSTAGNAVMSGYQNLIEGRTTVRAARKLMGFGLLDSKKVEYDKNGHVKAFSDGALLNSEQFKQSPYEWMQKTLLPALAKKGITGDKEIVSTIGSMFTNRSASNLFATMYMQRNQIAKNERLNKGAAGITELNAIAQEQTSGKEIAALARLRDLKNEIGEKVTPLYNAGLEATAAVTQKVVGFMKEHSTTAKIIITALAALAAVLLVCGTLTIALAGVLGPLAVLRFSMMTLGMQGGILARGLGLGVTALRAFGSAAMLAGRAMLMTPIGLAITAVVAVIAGAAYLIYRNWKPISGFFAGLWEGTREAFSSAVGWITQFLMNWTPVGFIADHWNDLKAITVASWALIKAGIVLAAESVSEFFMTWTLVGIIVRHWDDIKTAAGGAWDWIENAAIAAGRGITEFFMNWTLVGAIVRNWDEITSFMSQLVIRFTTIGGQIIDGMVSGILGGMGAVRTALHNVGESAINWFKEKLGIHSPSRVFAELGGFIAQGAANGIDDEKSRIRTASVMLATVAATSFVAPGLANGMQAPLVRPTVPIDTRAPIASAAAANPANLASAMSAPAPIVINIYPQAGSDPQAIAKAVAAELDRRDRTKRSRAGSSLSDSVN